MPTRRALSLVSRSHLAMALGCALSSFSHAARADEKQACVSAYEKALELRREAKFSAARDSLSRCAREECPPLVRAECAQGIADVGAAMPSIVVGARDERGRDLVHVRVIIDGRPATDSLDGRSILLDPGVHVLRVEGDGERAHEEQVLVRQGEKNRPVTLVLEAPRAPLPPTGRDTEAAGPPVWAWVFGGIGVASLGTALGLYVHSDVRARELRSCSPRCDQGDVDSVQTEQVASGVLLAVGLVATGASAFFFLGPRGTPKTTTLFISPRVGKDGTVGIGGQF